MRIRLTIPGAPDAESLGVALEAATRIAQHDFRAGLPSIQDAIDAGVEWRPEPPGDESFDPPSTVLDRGWGDCDDLAPWLAGEMRETGYDPGAQAIAMRSGPRTWHAIVKGSDGQIYDPSKWAGMPHDVVGQCMPCSAPLLGVGKPAIQVGMRHVRVDMPGILARRGCNIGAAYDCACDATDEDRVAALIDTIERAITTASLARTGDARALKSLAVIYRVLRGDDPEEALSGLRPQERVGVLPCLAALGPLASAAATAGTIAAVADPIAAALRELAGKDSDFGRAMQTLRDALTPVKLASSFGTGLLAMAEGGIPAGIQAGTARWAELLRAPGSAAAINDVRRVEDVARTMHWAESALAKAMPAAIATQLTPGLIDLLRDQKYDGAVRYLRDGILQLANVVPTPQWLMTVESMALNALDSLVTHDQTAPVLPGVFPTQMPVPQETPDATFAPALDAMTAAEQALSDQAEEDRADLRTLPVAVTVPPGWKPIFAAGCRQFTELC